MDSTGLVRGRSCRVICPPVRLQIRLTWTPVCACLKLSVLEAPDKHSLSIAVVTEKADRSQPLWVVGC